MSNEAPGIPTLKERKEVNDTNLLQNLSMMMSNQINGTPTPMSIQGQFVRVDRKIMSAPQSGHPSVSQTNPQNFAGVGMSHAMSNLNQLPAESIVTYLPHLMSYQPTPDLVQQSNANPLYRAQDLTPAAQQQVLAQNVTPSVALIDKKGVVQGAPIQQSDIANKRMEKLAGKSFEKIDRILGDQKTPQLALASSQQKIEVAESEEELQSQNPKQVVVSSQKQGVKKNTNKNKSKDQGDKTFQVTSTKLNLGNYTSEDMATLTQITMEMNRRMDMARGTKRGRKIQGFTDYCHQTTERINELKQVLKQAGTTDDQKKQLRNQISAYQARLKQRITNMDQELRLEQKTQQLSTIFNIVSNYADQTEMQTIFSKVDATFPEMDFFNSNAYKQSEPGMAALKAATASSNSKQTSKNSDSQDILVSSKEKKE